MTAVFWMGFAYGFCMGLLFWCRDVLTKEWMNAFKPAAAP